MFLIRKHQRHAYMGWLGTVIALGDYGAFSLALIPELWFFGLGMVASVFLAYALFKDRAHYGGVLQVAFLILNLLGILRVSLTQ